MNTTVYTRLYSQTDEAVLHDVARLFASFERRLSRFDPDSELSRLNACQRETFKASPTLLSALEVALDLARVTNGLYDPAILTLLERAGYNRSFELVANPRPLKAATPDKPTAQPTSQPANQPTTLNFTFRSIQINRARREIHRPVGLKLDLGGMGKGWTVDRAADRLQGLGPFLINAGGDIFAYQAPPGEKGWQIDLIHPTQPTSMMARLHLHHRALATSTIAKRRWQQNGQIMHHVINPRTGRPAHTDAISVTVVAHRTVLAEVYAKVALILGTEAGLAYLQRLPKVEGLIFNSSHQIVTTEGFAPLLDRVEPAGYRPS